MKMIFKAAALIAAVGLLPVEANAGSRVGVGADLTSPWTLQFKPKRRIVGRKHSQKLRKQRSSSVRQSKIRIYANTRATAPLVTGSVRNNRQVLRTSIQPDFKQDLLPTLVDYYGEAKPGTIVVNTIERRLYLILENGRARRYAIGVGKPGFEWSGTHKITRKAEWPSWTPPKEMIAREKKKGRDLPAFMEGGPQNPMGARALYLGSTIYRIHGTNQAWSIGKAVSSGCIRMRNEDVMDLYDRVPNGTTVQVI